MNHGITQINAYPRLNNSCPLLPTSYPHEFATLGWGWNISHMRLIFGDLLDFFASRKYNAIPKFEVKKLIRPLTLKVKDVVLNIYFLLGYFKRPWALSWQVLLVVMILYLINKLVQCSFADFEHLHSVLWSGSSILQCGSNQRSQWHSGTSCNLNLA